MTGGRAIHERTFSLRAGGSRSMLRSGTPLLMSAKAANLLAFEAELWQRGTRFVAGVDEAGRGPLAGPVVAAAVIFPPDWLRIGLPADLEGLNDSKQLTAGQRERFFRSLTSRGDIAIAVGTVDAGQVDELNILRATHRAMNEALARLQPVPEHVLMDGRAVKSLRFSQTALIKGDARSYSIAAASVVAKVTRDRLMIEYDRRWPEYGFAEHKGYGTAQHLAALAAHGPCAIHRRSFAPLKPGDPELF